MNSGFIYDDIFVSSVLGKLNYHLSECDVSWKLVGILFHGFENNKTVVFSYSFGINSLGSIMYQVPIAIVCLSVLKFEKHVLEDFSRTVAVKKN